MLSDEISDMRIYIKGKEIEIVDEAVYLGQTSFK